VVSRKSVAVMVLVLAAVALVAALSLSSAQDTPVSEVAKLRAVAAVPAESVTEYEPDPFEPERLRSSTVRVRRVAVVYEDGTVEVKACQ